VTDLLLLPLLLILFLSLSKNNLAVSFSLLSLFFYLCVMLFYFHLVKYGGEYQVTFPDENTYINGTSLLLFSTVVNYLFDTVGATTFRIISLLMYNISIIVILNRLQVSDKLNWVLVAFLCLGNYWNFFILKEGLTICGLLVTILYLFERKLIYLLLGTVILIVARPDALFLIHVSDLLYRVYKVSKIKFYLLTLLGAGIGVLIVSLPISQPLKLGFISRRSEDVYKTYDPETIAAASLTGFDFISSSIYLETVAINFNRAFNYLYNSFGLASLLVSINFGGLVLCSYYLWKGKYFRANLFFIISNLVLVLSHNNYRYANSVIIPYLMFLSLERKNESTNNESQ
jgi:hypothetical protein